MISRVNWDTRRDEYRTVFIDKSEFSNEVVKSLGKGVRTNRAGELIIQLSENILMSNHFKLTASDFMVTEAMVDHVIMWILENGLRLYSTDKNNAFSYFSLAVFSKGYDFLRDRFGERKRLDLYGQNIKFKYNKRWCTMELVNLDDKKD